MIRNKKETKNRFVSVPVLVSDWRQANQDHPTNMRHQAKAAVAPQSLGFRRRTNTAAADRTKLISAGRSVSFCFVFRQITVTSLRVGLADEGRPSAVLVDGLFVRRGCRASRNQLRVIRARNSIDTAINCFLARPAKNGNMCHAAAEARSLASNRLRSEF